MRLLPASYSDELDVEVESPEAVIEMKKGNFSRLYSVLQEYKKSDSKNADAGDDKGLLKRMAGLKIPGKKKKQTGKNPDFKRINFVFPEKVIDSHETRSALDSIRNGFRDYCSTERKKEGKSAERLNLVKDLLIFGGTIAVTYGLGGLVYAGYIAMLKETPLLISAAADAVLAAGFGVRHKEMAHRDKVGKIGMVDDAELNFVTGNEYKTLLLERKHAPPTLSQGGNRDSKTQEATILVEIDCRDFYDRGEFQIDRLIDAYEKLLRPEKKEGLRKRVSNYVNEKILRKTDSAAKMPGQAEDRLGIIIHAGKNCEAVPGLGEKFREYCRSERMKSEKNANLVEGIKDVVTFIGPLVTTYGLSLAVYESLIESAKHMPLLIDTAADGVLVSGLIPRRFETKYRERAKMFEKFGNAEITIDTHSSGEPGKDFYSRIAGRA